jgi:hypothetical protein
VTEEALGAGDKRAVKDKSSPFINGAAADAL